MTPDRDLALLDDPVAKELLHSAIPARLAYTWPDGSPRVVPIAFHWNGAVFTLGTPPKAPKVKALQRSPLVALTIDDITPPYKVLLVRGTAELEHRDRVVPEYEQAIHRYYPPDAAKAWLDQIRDWPMVKITITPTAVRILDFVTRFPSAIGL
jgi:nitroimidazol reductase NimA-like FMN-containing flavoprotein (pyridoxamine 5'-phosphate oxidase superfamily)